MAALRAEAEEQKTIWTESTWGTGEANQAALTELRAKAAALLAITEATYEGLCEIHGQDPLDD